MTQIAFANLNRVETSPRIVLPRLRGKDRRLDVLIKGRMKHLAGRRFLVSVHKPGEIFMATNDNVWLKEIPASVRSYERPQWQARHWSNKRLAKDDIVLITDVPQGGGRGSSAAKIGLTVASLALMVFAAWAGPAVASGLVGQGVLTAGSTAAGIVEKVITAGVVIGGGAAIAAVARQGNKGGKLYGVTGGGNIVDKDGRIPVPYGKFWDTPKLTQYDYFTYEGESMTLYKRMCLGCGKSRVKGIRVGATTMWTETGTNGMPNGGVITDVTSPFVGTEFEVIYGQASTLVPGDVISSPNVNGALLPLQNDPNPWSGWWVVNPLGTEIDEIQVDYQYRGGYWKHNTGTSLPIGLRFQYALVDDGNNVIGAPVTFYSEYGDRKIMTPQRFTRKTGKIPRGRYAVRAQNDVFRFSPQQEANFTRDIQWDALRGYTPDTRVRQNRTELAIRIVANKDMTVTQFSNVEVLIERYGPVYDAEAGQFVEAPIRKALDAYVDTLRDTFYGNKTPDNLIDLTKIAARRDSLTQFDTVNGKIAGPVSLWEACKTILANVRAEPIRIGAGFSYVRDEPKALRRHTFTRREIVRNSSNVDFEIEADDGSCDVEVFYFKDGDPRQRLSARATYGTESAFGPRKMDFPFIDTYEHAMHIARWFAAMGFYRRAQTPFQTELPGRLILRGDPIAVDNWFVETRQVSGILVHSGRVLDLDADAEIGDDDYAVIRDMEGREWGPVALTQGSNSRQIVLDEADVAAETSDTGLSLAQVIAKAPRLPTRIVIGSLSVLSEQWLVESVDFKEKGKTAILAKLDNPLVFAAIDEPIPPDTAPTWEFRVSETPAIVALTASIANHTSSLELRFSILAQAGARRFRVLVSMDGEEYVEVYSGAAASGSVPIRFSDEPVLVVAQAFGAAGLPGLMSTPFSVVCPVPVVTALVPYDALMGQTKALFERLAASEQEIRAALDAAGGAIASMQAILRNADLDQVQKAERIQAVAANALSQVTGFSTVQAAMGRAFAAFGVDVTAAVSQNNAGSFLRLISEADESGALAVLRLAVSASLGGPATEAAIELSTDGIRTLIAFIAEFLTIRSRDGRTIVEWDTETGSMNLFNTALYAALMRDKQGPDWRMELTGKHLIFRWPNGIEAVFLGIR